MLRSLQLEINERTRELHGVRQRDNGLSPAQQKELELLSSEQGTLAELVHDLMQSDAGDEP
jgi:hypothetical protein